MKRMFAFDTKRARDQFAAQDYVHIPRGLTEEYYAVARKQVEQNLQTGLMEKFAIGDKQQALYQFPNENYLEEFLETVGAVCGLEPAQLVISERHIKAYESDADPLPLAHKDRLATQVAVGFSIYVPEGSTLVLYPDAEREINPFNTSTELRASLRAEALPEKTLQTARRVEIQDGPRDVMLFRGNSIWHMRVRPAHTVMLYFKLNAYHCDPLGEDPRTAAYQARTRRQAAAPDAGFEEAIPILGRRVDYIHRRYNRQWQETTGVVLWGARHITIDEQELKALQAMDGRRSVRAVVCTVGGGSDDRTLLKKIRQLAEIGIVDLLGRNSTPLTSE
jgi:hypothetical protein